MIACVKNSGWRTDFPFHVGLSIIFSFAFSCLKSMINPWSIPSIEVAACTSSSSSIHVPSMSPCNTSILNAWCTALSTNPCSSSTTNIWLIEKISIKTTFWLVVWNIFYFPIYWEFHHPNWLSYFSEGWPNHQPALRLHCSSPMSISGNHTLPKSGPWLARRINCWNRWSSFSYRPSCSFDVL